MGKMFDAVHKGGRAALSPDDQAAKASVEEISHVLSDIMMMILVMQVCVFLLRIFVAISTGGGSEAAQTVLSLLVVVAFAGLEVLLSYLWKTNAVEGGSGFAFLDAIAESWYGDASSWDNQATARSFMIGVFEVLDAILGRLLNRQVDSFSKIVFAWFLEALGAYFATQKLGQGPQISLILSLVGVGMAIWGAYDFFFKGGREDARKVSPILEYIELGFTIVTIPLTIGLAYTSYQDMLHHL